MSVLIIVFLTAVVALFSGVFEQGKFARYIGIAGLLAAFYVSFLPEAAFFSRYRNMFEFGLNAALFTRISVFVTLLLFFLGGFAFSNHRSHQSELYALMLFSHFFRTACVSFAVPPRPEPRDCERRTPH